MKVHHLLATTLAVALLFTGRAHASGFAAARFGGEHGNVTATNPTALYFNPAGIAFSSGVRVFVDGTLALRHATWTHAAALTDPAEPAGAMGANAGKATLFNVFGGPMMGASARVGGLAMGLSISVPFGGRAHWNHNEKFEGATTFPLAADGVQRWHGIEGSLTFIYATAGLAYRLGPLAIGVTGNFIRSSIESTQAKTPTGDGDPDLMREGRAVLDVRGTQGSFGVGAMAEVVEDELWLSASYQAQPGLGTMRLDGTLTTVYQGGRTPFPVSFHQALPDITRFGARYRPNARAEVRVFGEFTRWSVLQSQCVGLEKQECAVDSTGADASAGAAVLQNLRRKWNDTVALRAGASHWLASGTELFAGIGLETAAVPDSTLDPGLADANNVSAALGGRFRVMDTLFIAGSYTHIQYQNRDNRGASRLADFMPPTKRPDGGGRYTQWIGLFNVNIEKEF